MRDTIRQHSLLTAVVVAGIVFPSMVAAQGTPEALERRAAGTVNVNHLGTVAGLLVRAAEMRGPADPAGVRDLNAAANAYSFSGKTARARELSVQAAERALAMGDVDQAAQAFLLAVIVADRQGDVVVRDSLIARANLLASSPLLSSRHREMLSQFAQAAKAPVKVATVKKP